MAANPEGLAPAFHELRLFQPLARRGSEFERINHYLLMADRERVKRKVSLSGVVLDSRSVKSTERGGPCGYDTGKKVKGRKRQVLVDRDGRAFVLDPQPANVQDCDGAVPVLRRSHCSSPFISTDFADAGYTGDKPATATILTVEIAKKPPDQIGFVVHPRHWGV